MLFIGFFCKTLVRRLIMKLLLIVTLLGVTLHSASIDKNERLNKASELLTKKYAKQSLSKLLPPKA
jgi:hypothetical protein